MEKFMGYTFYKYISLENFERFVEIIVGNRLYGAVYKELNDPMEGKFNKEGLQTTDFEEIYGKLKTTRICSLMKKQDDQKFPDNFLMWSHYANSHRGCCIEIKLTRRNNIGWSMKEVEYKEELPKVEGKIEEKILKILSVKKPIWGDEHEIRAIKIYDKDKFGSQSPFFHVVISAIYLGDKVSKEKSNFYKRVITSINPKIKVYKICEEKAETYFPELNYKEI